MAIFFDPRSAIVYFDLCFEEYNHDEDVSAAEQGNADAAERLAEVLKHDPADFCHALRLQESAAMDEVEARIRKALPQGHLSNEGHDLAGNLVMKVGVNTLEEAVSLAKLVASNTGGGDDCIYLNTAYFCVQGFRLYSGGVNGDSVALHELEEAIEDGRIAAPVGH